MKKLNMTLTFKIISLALITSIVGCNDYESRTPTVIRVDGAPGAAGQDGKTGQNGRDGVDGQDGKDGVDTTSLPSPVTYRQIERLARPAINEGLVVSNALLNAFNSVPPTADLSPAASAVIAEAAATLDAVDAADGVDDLTVAQVVAAFLPDVMRIDISSSVAIGTTAYNSCASRVNGILCGGRKIEDDVMDITLSFLISADASGASIKDNVSYAGVVGNAAQPGHKLLHGQVSRNGAATFPFLSAPN